LTLEEFQTLFDVRRGEVVEYDQRILRCVLHALGGVSRWSRAFMIAIDKKEVPLRAGYACKFSNSSGTLGCIERYPSENSSGRQ
jgi:hypothetical protein